MYQNSLKILHSEKRGWVVYFYGGFPFSNSDSSSKLISVISHGQFPVHHLYSIRIHVTQTNKKIGKSHIWKEEH